MVTGPDLPKKLGNQMAVDALPASLGTLGLTEEERVIVERK
jgi:hypothetical protein